MEIVPRETNYKANSRATLLYKHRQVDVDSAFAPTQAADVTCTFTVPSNVVFNPSKSYLSFDVNVPAQAVDFVNAHGILTPIKSVQVTTERGQVLCSITDFHPFSKTVRPLLAKKSNWQKQGVEDDKTTDGLGKCNGLTTANFMKPITQAGAVANGNGPHYDAFKYFASGGADNTDLTLYYKMKFGDCFPHTWLADKRDQYLGEELTITLTWAPTNEFAFDSDDADLANPGNCDAVYTVANTKLYLALQQNEGVKAALIDKVNNGTLTMRFPFVHSFKQTTTAGATHSQTAKLNISRGSSLLRVYTGLYVNTGNAIRWCNYNYGDTQFTDARTYVDAQPESDYALTTQQFFDQHQDLFKDSAIANADQFAEVACVVQDYMGPDAEDSDAVGISLQTPHDIMIEYNKAAAVKTCIMFCVCQKLLRVSRSGAEVASV